MIFLFVLTLVSAFFIVLLFFSSKIIIRSTNSEGTPVHLFEVRILFHAIRIRLSFYDMQKSFQIRFWRWPLLTKKISPKKGIDKKKKKTTVEKSKKRFSEKLLNRLSYIHLNLSELNHQIVTLLKSFRRPELKGRIRIGFGNPMYTGLLMGSYAMVANYWPEMRRDVSLQPEFTRAKIQWQLFLKSDFILAVLLWRGVFVGHLFWKMKRKNK